MGIFSSLLGLAAPIIGNAVGGPLGGVLGGLIGGSAGGGGSSPSGAAGIADPFAGQRPQYQQQLNSLMTGSFKPTDPSYKWRFDQGLEALNRTMGASGLLHSGNLLAALSDYGQNQASTEYSNQFQRLAQLSGANIGSPAVAAQMQGQQNAGTQAFLNQAGSAIAPVVKDVWNGTSNTGIGSWFNSLIGA